MYTLILFLHLGAPALVITTPDCTTAHTWLTRAEQWAARSGLQPGYGPFYSCRHIAGTQGSK